MVPLSLGHATEPIRKVVYAEEIRGGYGFSYLAGESDSTVYPDGNSVCN